MEKHILERVLGDIAFFSFLCSHMFPSRKISWSCIKLFFWDQKMIIKKKKQGITNTLALPIDKMLYIYILCPHFEHQKNSYQSKQSTHSHQRKGVIIQNLPVPAWHGAFCLRGSHSGEGSFGWTSTHVGTMVRIRNSISIISKYYKYSMHDFVIATILESFWILTCRRSNSNSNLFLVVCLAPFECFCLYVFLKFLFIFPMVYIYIYIYNFILFFYLYFVVNLSNESTFIDIFLIEWKI